MTLPTGYLPREGDLLTLRGRVRFNVDPGETEVHVSMVGATHKTFLISFDDVVDLYCRAWEPHDKVQEIRAQIGSHPKRRGEVIAVCDDQVWVKLESGKLQTYGANELEAQPNTDQPEAADIIPPSPAPAPGASDE